MNGESRVLIGVSADVLRNGDSNGQSFCCLYKLKLSKGGKDQQGRKCTATVPNSRCTDFSTINSYNLQFVAVDSMICNDNFSSIKSL